MTLQYRIEHDGTYGQYVTTLHWMDTIFSMQTLRWNLKQKQFHEVFLVWNDTAWPLFLVSFFQRRSPSQLVTPAMLRIWQTNCNELATVSITLFLRCQTSRDENRTKWWVHSIYKWTLPLQDGAPVNESVQLPYVCGWILWFMVDIPIVNGVYKPT